MCELKIIQVKDGNENEIMREVEKIEVEGTEIKVFDILGRMATIQGVIKTIDLMKNTVIVV